MRASGSAPDERVLDGFGREVDPNALHARVLADDVDAVLLADPAVLDATERRQRRERAVRVDPAGAGLEPRRERVRAPEIVRPDPRREPEARVVRDLQG